MRRGWMLLAVALVLPQFAWGEAAGPEAPLPFASGEKLSYDVRLLGVRAAEAEVKAEKRSEGSWRLYASGRTVGATNSIFGFRQTASCTVDAALQPEICLYTSRQRSGMKRRELRFDGKSGILRERTLEDGKRKERSYRPAAGEQIQELLAALYQLRRDLPGEGQTRTYRAMRKGKPVVLEAKVGAEETVDTRAGVFRARKVAVRVVNEVDEDAARGATVWFSADHRRLPLRMAINVRVIGSLDVELASAVGTLESTIAGR